MATTNITGEQFNSTVRGEGITLVDYVIPQIDQGTITGGPYEGLPVVCKGGLTGTEVTAIQSVNRILDERMRTHGAHA